MSDFYSPFVGGALSLATSITATNARAFSVTNSVGDVAIVDSRLPVNGLDIYGLALYAGGSEFAGCTANVIGLFSIPRVNSGSHSGALRGFHSQVGVKGTASATGVADFVPCGNHSAVVHDSTGTSIEIRGVLGAATMLAGGSVVAAGLVGNANAYVARVNYGSPTGTGSCTNGRGFYFPTPTNTHATRTISNLYGVHIENLFGLAGVGKAWAIKTEGGENQLEGGLTFKRVPTAINLLASVDDYLIAVTDTSAPRQVTLPTAALFSGKHYVVKDESGGAAGNNITVVGEGGETIDGAATSVINANYGQRHFYSDGLKWFVV